MTTGDPFDWSEAYARWANKRLDRTLRMIPWLVKAPDGEHWLCTGCKQYPCVGNRSLRNDGDTPDSQPPRQQG